MSLTDQSTRSIQIVSGSYNTTFTAPNLFTYNLPSAGFRSGNDQIALKSLTVYNSFPNISLAKNNNVFAYLWNNVTYQLVIPDGIWAFPDILSFLQQAMFSNGHYLVDSFGTVHYYISLIVNPTLYCLSLTVTPLPATLPAGWQNPGMVNLAAMAGTGPQLQITAQVTVMLAFAVGFYPAAPSTSVYNVNSGVPQITDVTSLNVICNLVDNSGWSLTPHILTSFSIPNNTSAGSLIQISPTILDWEGVSKQVCFTQITLAIVDQLGRAVQVRDPSGFVAILNLRRRQ